MKERTKEEIDASVMTMERIHKQTGILGENLFYKSLIYLAYEYIQCGHEQEGLVTLFKVPATYFVEDNVKNMEQDPQFADIVVRLSYRLIQIGVVRTDEHVPKANMTKANA